MSKLTREQISATADVINEKVNIPILGEKIERYVFIGAIVTVDEVLSNEAEFNIANYIAEPSLGVTKEEKTALVAFISKRIDDKVDIPVVTDGLEAMLFPLVIEALVDIFVAEVIKKNKPEDTADA